VLPAGRISAIFDRNIILKNLLEFAENRKFCQNIEKLSGHVC
jgi:hypothetical protein